MLSEISEDHWIDFLQIVQMSQEIQPNGVRKDRRNEMKVVEHYGHHREMAAARCFTTLCGFEKQDRMI
ncbi:hypothetical protein ACU4GD_11765 [Cupriavidus basilensis]